MLAGAVLFVTLAALLPHLEQLVGRFASQVRGKSKVLGA